MTKFSKKNKIFNKNHTRKCKNIFTDNFCDNTVIKYSYQNNFADFFVELMYAIGVKHVVGLVSSSLVYFYQALHGQDKIKAYEVRNERNGGYVSMGSSRLSSTKVYERSLIISYSDLGPGLMNMVDAIACSTLEQIPCIFVTSNESSLKKKNRVIQDINSEKIIENICKSYLVINKADILNGTIVTKIYETIIKGFSYPRGAIVFIFDTETFTLDASKYISKLTNYKKLFNSIFSSEYGFELTKTIKAPDVFTGLYGKDWKSKQSNFYKKNKNKIVKQKNIINIIKNQLKISKYPIMLIGMGAFDYIHDLLNFCEQINIPFILTLPMNGFACKSNKYNALRMGHSATHCGNCAIQKCDFLITWGTSLNQYTVVNLNDNLARIKCIIDVNINPALYETPFIDYFIIGDGKYILEHLHKNKEELIFEHKNIEWLNMIEKFKIEGNKLQSYFYSNDDKEHLKHGDIYLCIQNYVDKLILNTNKQVFFITDSGSVQPFTASFIDFKNKNYHFITDGKYGSIGSGVGELIGFALNKPNDLFILIAGDAATLDGSMCDYISIKEMNLKNIIVVILCNSGIGLIAEESDLETTQLLNYTNGYKYIPKWSSLMNSQLINSYIVRCKKDMDDYLKCCFEKLFKEDPSVLICIVALESYYSPIISIGNYFDKMKYFKPNTNSTINNCRYSIIE